MNNKTKKLALPGKHIIFAVITLILAVLIYIVILLCFGAEQQTMMTNISEQEAQSIALSQIGLKREDVDSMHSEINSKGDLRYYSINIHKNENHYDAYVDAFTGIIIQADKVDDQIDSSDTNTLPGILSEDEALSLVFERIPGASKSDLTSFEIERDDGINEYEGELEFDGIEYEFEIDAYSGIFREWKAEYIDYEKEWND